MGYITDNGQVRLDRLAGVVQEIARLEAERLHLKQMDSEKMKKRRADKVGQAWQPMRPVQRTGPAAVAPTPTEVRVRVGVTELGSCRSQSVYTTG